MVSLMVTSGVHGVNTLHILKRSATHHLTILFPGDRIEEPRVSPDIAYLQDPVNICNILGEKFGSHKSTIVVISPTRFEASFAVYDSFLPKSTSTGEPVGYNGRSFKASEQLQSLLEQSGLYTMPIPPSKAVTTTTAPVLPTPAASVLPVVVDLIGFSKGGIVLNQLLAELAVFSASTSTRATNSSCTSPLPRSAPLLHSLRHFHYLDAGLNCPGAYLNDPETFSQLATWCNNNDIGGDKKIIKINLHGTPRQWEDSQRPFLKAEKDRMVDLCRRYGIPVQVFSYFQGQTPSLQMHFDILKEMVLVP